MILRVPGEWPGAIVYNRDLIETTRPLVFLEEDVGRLQAATHTLLVLTSRLQALVTDGGT